MLVILLALVPAGKPCRGEEYLDLGEVIDMPPGSYALAEPTLGAGNGKEVEAGVEAVQPGREGGVGGRAGGGASSPAQAGGA